MKRILIFSVAYHPFVGGAEIAVKEITDRISDISFDMITMNLDGTQKSYERIGNINVYRLAGKGKIAKLLFPFRARVFAETLHSKNNYSLVWSIMATYSGFAAMFFKRKHKEIPFILTLQEGDPIEHIQKRVRFVYLWFKNIFISADKIQTISNYLADWALSMGAKVKPQVIPNGVDTELFSRMFSLQELEEKKKALDKNNNDIFLITTSRLVIKNDVESIIDSLTYLPDNIKLLIIGSGELRKKLESKVKENKVSERVNFLGQVDYKDIPSYLAVSDIFVRPSLSEGMGNSFIEAMSAGLPVIATNVGGIPDFLKDGETGLFCEVKNSKNIAEKVLYLLNNPEIKSRIIENSRNLVISTYDWKTIADKIKTEIFDRV